LIKLKVNSYRLDKIFLLIDCSEDNWKKMLERKTIH
jgi:hypothetical protein